MSPEEKLAQIGMRVSPLPPNRAAKLAAELEAIQREFERCAQKKGNGGADSLSDLDARIGPQPAPANGADYDGAQAPSADARGTRAETPGDDPRPPAFSDDALALRFADQHADDLRFVAKWGQWFSWTGAHWRADDTLDAYDKVRATCREVALGCNKGRIATAIASAKTVASVERLAKADRRLAATVEQWDADPWLLNTPSGVVDLRAGRMRAHRADDYMTKITAAGPGGDCPAFRAFLDRITGSDAELVAYHQRALGYALTGDIREHALFFGYGTGANGKSVELSTVAGIFNTYHRTAPIETFTASNTDRHPTDLAMLQGARLVTANETEEGRRWAESRIKQLTGGDPVSARFMRQDFFEFRPTFKLIIAGNHKPSLRTVDEAIRRRFHLIPFSVTIPADERDGELTEKLKEEWPGILAWLIKGCLEWQREGLRPPRAVLEATEAYLSAEDSLAAWVDERCDRAPQAWSSLSALFASWSDWAVKAGEVADSQKRFSQKLEARGFQLHKRNIGQGFYGLLIRLLESDDEPWGDEK
jgi:putative DNA primase/helicase